MAKRTSKELTVLNKEYKARGGNFCPNCESENIQGEGVEVHVGCASQQVTCLDCFAAWIDQYILKGFSNLI